jgi:hypothetical protein
MVSAAVAGTSFRPPRSYTTLWDATVRRCGSNPALGYLGIRAQPSLLLRLDSLARETRGLFADPIQSPPIQSLVVSMLSENGF